MSYRHPWLAVLPDFPKCHPRGGGCHFFPNLACLDTTIMTRHGSASHNHDNRGNPTAKKGIATSATGFSRITALVTCRPPTPEEPYSLLTGCTFLVTDSVRD